MPLFGGFRGGRKRKDGLKPGGPEALEVQRRYDRIRNWIARDLNRGKVHPEEKDCSLEHQKNFNAMRQRLGAPLPDTLPSAVVPLAVPPLAGSTATPVVDLGYGPVSEAPAFVPWDGKMLSPIFEQAVPLAEELALRQINKKARTARLPETVLDEIERDSKWPDRSKKLLETASAQLSAKYLNRFGVSSEFQPEITFGVALATVAMGHAKVIRRLDKLIAAANANPGAAGPEKKT